MPGVLEASRSRSTSSASGTERVWTRRIAARPAASGGWTTTRRSKRPGRSSAGSSTSGRFVAASTITLASGVEAVHLGEDLVERLLALVVPADRAAAPPRERPIASSSSMKMIAGAASLACWKRSRTRDAPTPTIISMNSDAEAEKNGTLASPATARASSVLPVPGAPDEQHAARDARARAGGTCPGSSGSRRPRRAPARPRRCPATSLKVTSWVADSTRFARGCGRTGRAPRRRPPRRRRAGAEPDEQAHEQDRRAEAEQERLRAASARRAARR